MLTKKESSALNYILTMQQEWDYTPTLDEIGEEIGSHSRRDTHNYIQGLIQKDRLVSATGSRSYAIKGPVTSKQTRLFA